MNKTIPLSDIFHVSSRFRRSVHLERDFYAENPLDGYVVSVTARETLRRLISALENPSASKAWSLTGPYGSGKSAFALFAAKLLGDPESPAVRSKEVSIPFSSPENVRRLPLRKHIHVDCH